MTDENRQQKIGMISKMTKRSQVYINLYTIPQVKPSFLKDGEQRSGTGYRSRYILHSSRFLWYQSGMTKIRGVGQGIGRAIALRLADDGFDVAVNDISEEKLTDVMSAIKAKGRRSSGHVADVSVEPQVKRMIENAVQEHGSLDVVS